MASYSSTNPLNEPLSPPPPGVTPDFAHPQTEVAPIYISAGICITLILVFSAMRFYAKLRLTKESWWNDFVCALGVAGGLCFICITIATVAAGSYGKHQWELTIADFTKTSLVLSLLAEVLYPLFIWLIKLNLFLLYLEIFQRLKWLRYLAIGGIIVTGLFYLTTMALFAGLCSPRTGQTQFDYIEALASEECAKIWPAVITTGVFNIASDIYLIILPLPAVWGLNMSLWNKIAVSAVFLTGVIACIASTLGLVYRVNLAQGTDNTWTTISTWVTAIIEMTAGIMVCCMPTTWAVLKSWKTPFMSMLTTHLGSWRSRSTFKASGSERIDDETDCSERIPMKSKQGSENDDFASSQPPGLYSFDIRAMPHDDDVAAISGRQNIAVRTEACIERSL